MDEINGILREVPNVKSGCLKLSARFSLSRRAKKTTDRMIELRRDCCKFITISEPGPPPATQVVPLGTTHEFESRKKIEEDIMTSLRNSRDVNMIGICGMGGLGKTTMAKRLMNRALQEHAFEEVVMAVVSRPVDKEKIQLEIGGCLHLDLKNETSEASRAQKLHARLSGPKKILLVLDDIWERLEVEELGIPRGCTILLTSRNHDVLRAMNVEKIFGMEVLYEEEAWFMFKERVGTCVDDIQLNSTAHQVVEECRGLPMALTTVSAVLKDEKNMYIWNDALRQLRQCDPDIPELIANVYNPLKLSYDVLGSKNKSVFLLCCLFGEDDDIPLEYLTYFCMGLGIFEGGIRNVEEARNRMSALTKMLTSRSLLLESENGDHCVRMHDVVRDVCRFIAKQEGYIGGNDCTWISSFQTTVGEITMLPTNLRLLFLSGFTKLEENIKFDDSFVEGIRDLHVLCIQYYSPLTSLPQTTKSLTILNTLILDSCSKLETISVVGELVNLEILICRHCGLIKELPPELKGLNHLKLLDLTWCENLERLCGGIISSLVGLEELKMLHSFKKWEAWDRNEKENGNGNAGLRELESLINLRCLEIEIEDVALATEKMRLSSKLERFHIRIDPYSDLLHSIQWEEYLTNKKMSLELEGETYLGDWIGIQLLRDTECLQLTGNGANNVDYLAKCQNIRWLRLGHCKAIKNIGKTSMDDATVFPFIEHLNLSGLPNLEEILDGPISSNSFHKLKELHLEELRALKQLWTSSSSPGFHNLSSIFIYNCPCLRNLEQLSIAGMDCLSQLQTLTIGNCEMMERVFLWNEEDQWRITGLMFPKLKEVELDNLPNLATFEFPLQAISSIKIRCCPRLRNLGQWVSEGKDCLLQLENLVISDCEMMEQVFLWNEEYEGIGGIEFPLLRTLSIKECPKMIVIGSNQNNSEGSSNNAHIDHNHSSPLFSEQQKMSFGSLKKLTITGNDRSMSLFSSSIAANLVGLTVLSISKCDEMVQVIQDEEKKKGVIGGDQKTLLFHNLEELELKDLRKLQHYLAQEQGEVQTQTEQLSHSLPGMTEPQEVDMTSNYLDVVGVSQRRRIFGLGSQSANWSSTALGGGSTSVASASNSQYDTEFAIRDMQMKMQAQLLRQQEMIQAQMAWQQEMIRQQQTLLEQMQAQFMGRKPPFPPVKNKR